MENSHMQILLQSGASHFVTEGIPSSSSACTFSPKHYCEFCHNFLVSGHSWSYLLCFYQMIVVVVARLSAKSEVIKTPEKRCANPFSYIHLVFLSCGNSQASEVMFVHAEVPKCDSGKLEKFFGPGQHQGHSYL